MIRINIPFPVFAALFIALLLLGIVIPFVTYKYNKKFKCPKCRFRNTCHKNPADPCGLYKKE